MINYGKQRSTVQPEKIEILQTKVFVASGITPVEAHGADEQENFTGFEFDLMEYTKDEYIGILAEKNDEMQDELTSTQLALCDIYEKFC